MSSWIFKLHQLKNSQLIEIAYKEQIESSEKRKILLYKLQRHFEKHPQRLYRLNTNPETPNFLENKK